MKYKSFYEERIFGKLGFPSLPSVLKKKNHIFWGGGNLFDVSRELRDQISEVFMVDQKEEE